MLSSQNQPIDDFNNKENVKVANIYEMNICSFYD